MSFFFHKTFYGFSIALMLTAVQVLFSCDAENTYTNHRCYFIFNTSYHPSSILMASVTSDDGFCLVYKGFNKGYDMVYIEKYGTSDPNSPYLYTTSTEPKVSELVIGWDNGLLIGFSAIENKILAFDRHCPKCESNAKAKLQWNGSSKSVKCPVCGSVYNLTLSGNGLSSYPVSYIESMYGSVLRVVH